jgi:hypothetical protein
VAHNGTTVRGNESKEQGLHELHVLYVTVFFRNAANLTHLLIKGPKFRNGNEIEDFGFKLSFLGSIKIDVS